VTGCEILRHSQVCRRTCPTLYQARPNSLSYRLHHGHFILRTQRLSVAMPSVNQPGIDEGPRVVTCKHLHRRRNCNLSDWMSVAQEQGEAGSKGHRPSRHGSCSSGRCKSHRKLKPNGEAWQVRIPDFKAVKKVRSTRGLPAATVAANVLRSLCQRTPAICCAEFEPSGQHLPRVRPYDQSMDSSGQSYAPLPG
jgi:hypothetical protein